MGGGAERLTFVRPGCSSGGGWYGAKDAAEDDMVGGVDSVFSAGGITG